MGISCIICFSQLNIQYHHTIPRSRGGEDSLQIPLCSNCHSSIHFNALSIVSKINNPKRKNNYKRFWASSEEEERVEPYLKILVKALVEPIPMELSRNHVLTVSVPSILFDQFKLLQLDLGLSSQEKVLEYCINQTLAIRGLKDVITKEQPTNPTMWFL